MQAQKSQIEKHRTQTLLPSSKVDPKVLYDLQIAPVEASALEYNSIYIVDQLLAENRSCKELEDLQVKARAEAEETWQMRDGLLL